MSTREQLDAVLSQLPEKELSQLLDIARALARDADEDREAWQQAGLIHLARAYGPDEPDYSESDVKPRK